MQTSPEKQKFNSSRRDFFQSSSLSKGFFHENEEEYEPHNYEEAKEQINSKSFSQSIQGFSEQTSESQVYSSRRKKQSTLQTLKKQQNSLEEEKPITSSSHIQRKTYKKRSTKQSNNEVQVLDDDELIIHDQIMFSKSISLPKQQPTKKQRVQSLTTKEQQLFQFDNNNDDEQQQKEQDNGRFNVVQNGKEQIKSSKNNRQNKQQQFSQHVATTTKMTTNGVDIKSVKKSKFQIVFQPSQIGGNNSSQNQQQQQQQTKQQSQSQKQQKNTQNQPHSPSTLNELVNDNSPQSIKPKNGPISSQHMQKVLTFPIPKKMVMKTNIKRVSGFFNIYPQYHVYFQADKTYLMSAKRVSKTPYSTFIISTNQNNFQQNSPYYLGKAKGTVMGDQLDIFGPGLSPSAAFDKKLKPRQFIASIVYETRILNSGQPRDFSVYIKKPQIDYYLDFPQIAMYKDEIPLNLLYQNPHNRDKLILLKNKKPQYVTEIKSYSLNFNGRAGVASVKNFILQNKLNSYQQQVSTNKNPSIWPMLFGKVNQNNFNMDIGVPLSPFIAFGVALSSFDEKFFCE